MCSVSSHLNTDNNIKPLWKGQVNEQPDRMHHELLNASARTLHRPARSEPCELFGDEQATNIEEYLGGL